MGLQTSGKIFCVRIAAVEICPTRKSEPKVSVGHKKNLTGDGALNTKQGTFNAMHQKTGNTTKHDDKYPVI